MAGIEFIRDLAVVLGVAGAAGWICQRIGLSVVIGYLAAGAIAGPHTPLFQLVTELSRVQLLSQVGLVFLIFSIGLELSLQRFRRLGLSTVLATVISAILVFNGCRLVSALAGWSNIESLFFAGVLMVSSSTIICRVLQELHATHRRDGQLALGITLLEDIVAVVMLTVLATLVQFGGQESPPLARTVGALTAFIVFLVLTALFFVPRLLLRLSQAGRPEVRNIVVIALLLFLAWLAHQAGYSLALGAFLLGVVVSSTPQKLEIERVFEGLRDMFGAVFFVAMGMMVDFQLLASTWPLVLAVTAFALVWRPVAATIGLVLAGHQRRESMRAGLALAPLGEFSLITAQMGVMAGVVPEQFFPMAVGASILTTLAAPILMRRSANMGAWVDDHLPTVVRGWIAFYHSWLERLIDRRQHSILWRLTSRRLVQVAAGVLLVTAVILFAKPLYGWLQLHLGDDWLFPNGTAILFWAASGVTVLAPLVAIWRNIGALSLIAAEWATKGRRRRSTLQPLIERALQTVASILLVLWLVAVMPFGWSLLWAFLVVIAVMIVMAAILWRRLVYWQSRLEIELRDQVQSAFGPKASLDLPELLRERQDAWQLQAEEYVLPQFSASAGRRIGETALRQRFGVSIASIERQGILIVSPGGNVVLYPQDKLLLLGGAEQIDRAILELGAARIEPSADIEEFSLETVRVPENSAAVGKTLAELDPFRRSGVQVAGIQRNNTRILTPSGKDQLKSNDELLVLGTTRQIREFEQTLNGVIADDPSV